MFMFVSVCVNIYLMQTVVVGVVSMPCVNNDEREGHETHYLHGCMYTVGVNRTCMCAESSTTMCIVCYG